jgi:hypothetical protein
MDQSFEAKKEIVFAPQDAKALEDLSQGRDPLQLVALDLAGDPSALNSYSAAALKKSMGVLPCDDPSAPHPYSEAALGRATTAFPAVTGERSETLMSGGAPSSSKNAPNLPPLPDEPPSYNEELAELDRAEQIKAHTGRNVWELVSPREEPPVFDQSLGELNLEPHLPPLPDEPPSYDEELADLDRAEQLEAQRRKRI